MLPYPFTMEPPCRKEMSRLLNGTFPRVALFRVVVLVLPIARVIVRAKGRYKTVADLIELDLFFPVANLLGNFGPALTYEVFVHLGVVLSIPVSAGES